MNLDLSNLPHLEERQALLAKLNVRATLIAQRNALAEPFTLQREPIETAEEEADAAARAAFRLIETEQNAIIEAAQTKLTEARDALSAAHRASADVREKAEASIDAAEEEALKDINQRIEAFDEALAESLGENHPWTIVDDDDYIERCVLTGLPIRDDDELLEETIDTGGNFLYRALAFPNAEPISDEAKELASSIEEAA